MRKNPMVSPSLYDGTLSRGDMPAKKDAPEMPAAPARTGRMNKQTTELKTTLNSLIFRILSSHLTEQELRDEGSLSSPRFIENGCHLCHPCGGSTQMLLKTAIQAVQGLTQLERQRLQNYYWRDR